MSDQTRTHAQIIADANGPAAFADAVNPHLPPEAQVTSNTTKAWKRNDSIPSPYWEATAAAGVASLAELASAAAAKAGRRGGQAEGEERPAA